MGPDSGNQIARHEKTKQPPCRSPTLHDIDVMGLSSTSHEGLLYFWSVFHITNVLRD